MIMLPRKFPPDNAGRDDSLEAIMQHLALHPEHIDAVVDAIGPEFKAYRAACREADTSGLPRPNLEEFFQ